MQKMMMALVLFLLIGWAGSDALAGQGNGKGRGRGGGRNAKPDCGCEEEKAEKAEPACETCAKREEEKKAKKKRKGGKKSKGKKGGGKNAQGKRGGCDDCDGGSCEGEKNRERNRARGNGNGKGRGRGNGNGCGDGQGQGNGCGNGNGQGQGKGNGAGQGKGNGCGDGQGQGKGCESGQGQGQGKGGSCALIDDGTPAKPASKEYLARLQATLEEELYARDYYRAAYDALDNFRRFGNLSRAEQNHADAVAAAITRLGGKPVLEHSTTVSVPESVAAADAECTVIEKQVIEIYAGLIKDCPDEAVKKSLERIQQANHRHLSVVNR